MESITLLNNNNNGDINNNDNGNNQNAFQPGLGACGASLSSPGRLVLSNLIGARNRQKVDVRQDYIVPDIPRLAKYWLDIYCTPTAV